jgi:hypothetical protein
MVVLVLLLLFLLAWKWLSYRLRLLRPTAKYWSVEYDAQNPDRVFPAGNYVGRYYRLGEYRRSGLARRERSERSS